MPFSPYYQDIVGKIQQNKNQANRPTPKLPSAAIIFCSVRNVVI
jgi:hypothetical protein